MAVEMLNGDAELVELARTLGLSEAEVRLNLGCSRPTAQDARTSALNGLQEMFPHIPPRDVQAALNEANGDVARAAEQLLSFEALQPEIAAVDEIGSRKLRKEAKRARKQQQRQRRGSDSEKQNVAALAEILGTSVDAARQLYLENGSSITDAVLAKCNKGWTVVPTTQQQRIQTLEDINDYSGMSTRQLQAKLSEVDARLESARQRAQHYRMQTYTKVLSSEAHSELRDLVADRRDIERALNRESFFRSAMYKQHSIDLHGLSLTTAQSVCRDVVRDFKANNAASMEIVTGAGRHSPTGRSVIKDWLRQFLKAEKVRAQELEGSFVLRKKTLV